ncbi:UDP-N-acetylenolpyruvoylglucosamine reductase [Striga asiatica]|uniref:UDP-N-acetylenolpyruvoylglucosamine reductase n=1 Tax=Striga asiatica TaxID=4170 RepID=A0A5A7QWN4_STRAF|nr:UDP-N-acetylenolpyruvoylglucosamine reductase [Striga asiatica]
MYNASIARLYLLPEQHQVRGPNPWPVDRLSPAGESSICATGRLGSETGWCGRRRRGGSVRWKRRSGRGGRIRGRRCGGGGRRLWLEHLSPPRDNALESGCGIDANLGGGFGMRVGAAGGKIGDNLAAAGDGVTFLPTPNPS